MRSSSIFGNVLLGFAIVVLFVSTFIIYNTFAILVGQRTQQLGLLRSVGASANQIRFMVLFESVIIGIVASILGLFGGLGVAWLLKQLFSTGGNAFPDGPLELQPRTIVVVIIVGLVVTVASALIPALRASRVAPLEAVRGGGRKERSMTFRLIAGAVVLLPGLAALGIGMFGDVDDTAARLSLIGLGAALTFIGVSMLSALFAGQSGRRDRTATVHPDRVVLRRRDPDRPRRVDGAVDPQSRRSWRSRPTTSCPRASCGWWRLR